MKGLYIFLTLSIFGLQTNAQHMSLDVDVFTGTMQSFYLLDQQLVTHVDASGGLVSLFYFDSQDEANQYMKKPNLQLCPAQNIEIEGVTLYLSSFNSIEYYPDNGWHSGKIMEINGLRIEYYQNNEHHAGKLKSVGGVSFEYNTIHHHNTDKVSKVGRHDIHYYVPSQHHAGKLKRVGSIEIDYYTPGEHHTGKLKTVGNLTLEFNNPGTDHPNKFKSIKGTDERFWLI